MDLRPGYKQTDVGVIPEEWDVEPLERVSHPRRAICYGIVQVGRFESNGVDVLAIKNLNGDYTTDIHRCAPEIERAYVRSRVRPGDVLVSVKGTIGRVGLVPSHYIGNISRDLARISLTQSDVPEFWFQLLQSAPAQRRLEETTVGTTRQELSIGPLKKVEMPRPPKAEQRAIATALSDVDALLDALERLIAKKRDLKQAAMQQLLTGLARLPGFDEKWSTKPFDQVLVRMNLKAYQVPTSEYQCTGKYPIVDQGKETIAGYSNYESKKFCCPPEGVIVFGDHTCIAKFVDFDFLVGADGTQVLIAKPRQCTRFHAYQLQYRGIESTGYNRHYKFLKERDFHAPPFDEQVAISAVLADMDAEIDAHQARLAKTRDLKQAMMQDLLTGRPRLV